MHARSCIALGLPITGVVGPNAEKRSAFAKEFGAVETAVEIGALLERHKTNLVIVASPNADHFAQASAAVRAGVNVLVEKPVTTTLADAVSLARLAGEHRVIVAVGHMWRYHDDVLALRERIASGDYGTIVRTHGYGVHAKWGPSGWFTELRRSGGGALIDMGIHAIDTARFLLGDPLPTRVQASIGVGVFRDGLEVEDDGLIIIDWNNGARSLVEFGWWQSRLGGLEAETEVVGTSAAAQIWPDFGGFGKDYEHCSLGMYQRQLDDVVSCVKSGRAPRASIDVGITALQIVCEAYEAARVRYQPTRNIKTWEPRWHESI
jgi:predicted dehydrogenase